MNNNARFRQFAGVAVSVCAVVTATIVRSFAADAATRPIVLVFPVGNNVGSDVEVKRDASDGLTSEQRTTAAARGVRECLNDSGAVSAILYNPESAMFVRAISEANIHLEHPRIPSESEREAIGKAFDAIYVVAVSARPAVDSSTTLELVIQGNDVVSKKSFSDQTLMSATMHDPKQENDSDSIHRLSGNAQFDNVVMSAANTVTQHLLQGPLGDYFKPATPPELQPKQLMPAPINTLPKPVAPAPAEVHTSAVGNPSPVAGSGTPAPTAAVPAQPATSGTKSDTDLEVSNVTFTHNVVAPKSAKVTAVGAPVAADKPAKAIPETAPLPDLHGVDALHQALALGNKPSDTSIGAKKQAVELLASGDGSAAISMLRKAIDQDPLSASLRIELAKAYLSAHRSSDAAGEARRALALLPDMSPAEQAPLAGVFAQSFAETGDTAGARATYNEIIATHSSHVAWAQVAIADLDAADGKTTEAEAEYRAVLEANRNSREAAVGLARLLAGRGDYDGAVKALKQAGSDSSPESASARFEATTSLFDEGITKIATLLTTNRKAWEGGSLSQEIMFNATTAQTARVTGLVAILKAVPPPTSDVVATKSYRRRVYAAAILAQASSDLLNFLQTGDVDSGAQSSLELVECRKEIEEAQHR